MTATTVGMAWGMAALGITSTPRVARETVVRATGLTKRFGEHAAVSNVSFKVRRGDDFGFLGPYGMGKSTTIGRLRGRVHPASGSIECSGLSAGKLAERVARADAIIESPAVFRYRTGHAHLTAFAQLQPSVSIVAGPDGNEGDTIVQDGSERHGRSEIIRAVHGVTPTGNWFLLADISPNLTGNARSPNDSAATTDDAWLVVLGHRCRDIINKHEQDA